MAQTAPLLTTPVQGVPPIVASTFPTLSEEAQANLFQKILTICHGCYEDALRYFETAARGTYLPQQCPRSDATLKTIEFDNIKLFYCPTWPEDIPSSFSWNFYIARPGSGPQECIDPNSENIVVLVRGFDSEWSDCAEFTVIPEARVRIVYTYDSKRLTHEIVFPREPAETAAIPIHYLELM